MYVSRPSMLAFSYRLSGLSLPSLTGALRRLVGVASPAAGTGIDERGARGGQRNEHGGVPVGDGDKFGRLRVGSLEKVFQLLTWIMFSFSGLEAHLLMSRIGA